MIATLRQLIATDPQSAARQAMAFLETARAADDDGEIGHLAYVAAQARSQEGRNAEALALIAEAERAFLRGDDRLMATRVQLGRMHVLNELGRHGDALELGATVEGRLATQGLDDGDRWLLPTVVKNLGVTLGLLGRHQEALDAYDRALAGYRSLGMDDEAPPLLHNAGCELLALGRPDEALRRYRRAAARFAASGEVVAATQSRRDGATAHLQLGRFERALRVLRTANRRFGDLGMDGEVARTRMDIGRALLLLGQLQEAEQALRAAVRDFDRLALPHDRAAALLGLGRVLLRRNRDQDAIGVLATAADLADACDDQPLQALAILESGLAAGADPSVAVGEALAVLGTGNWPVQTAHVHLHGVGPALDAGRLEAARAHLAGAEAAVSSAPRPDLQRRVAHARGLVRLAEGQPAAAVLAIDEAVTDLRTDSLGLTDHLARLRFLDDSADAMNDLVVALLAADRTQDAAEALSHRKAWVLERQLRSSTAVGEPSSSGAQTTDTPPEAVVVSWQAHRGQLRAFVHHGTRTTVHELGPMARIEVVVGQLEAQWVRLRGGGPVVARFADRLADTADHLLSLLRAWIVDPLDLPVDVPLVLSPDGSTSHVPFAALGGRARPLVADHRISVTPATGLTQHWDDRLELDDAPLLLAPTPDALPGAVEEVQHLAVRMPGAQVLIGHDATLDALGRGLRPGRHVHLACHGRFRTDAPFASDVQLADGWTSASTLASLPWTDTTVVLSACAVGRSAALGGERAGMARALLGAGARAVVVAKWDVPDDLTGHLLSDTYDAAISGSPVSAALQRAQRAAAATGAHPVGWAAFEVMHR